MTREFLLHVAGVAGPSPVSAGTPERGSGLFLPVDQGVEVFSQLPLDRRRGSVESAIGVSLDRPAPSRPWPDHRQDALVRGWQEPG